jgi:hypothetical protein
VVLDICEEDSQREKVQSIVPVSARIRKQQIVTLPVIVLPRSPSLYWLR